MHMLDNIKTFLYDKKYFISIFNNCIHIFNYEEVEKLSDTQIILKLVDFKVKIDGERLRVNKMIGKEIQIVGEINNVEFQR